MGPQWPGLETEETERDHNATTSHNLETGKPQLRPPPCDTRVSPEEKRTILAQR